MSSLVRLRGRPVRRQGSRRAWLLAALLAALPLTFYVLSGCSSGGTQPYQTAGGDPAVAEAAFGAVEGIVVRGGNGLLVVVPSPPAGGANVPVRGAAVRLVGGGPQQAVTDARGYFRLQGVPTGLRRLRVEASGLGGEEFPLTVLADATIRVGERTVTRAAAVERAKQAIAALGVDLDAARLMAAQQPFPAGTRVAPAYLDAERENPALFTRTLDRDAWFVYADRSPGQRFEHDVDFVFVDVETGEVLQDVRGSFPAVNGRRYYGNDRVNVTSPDLVQNPTRAAKQTPPAPVAALGTRGVAANVRLVADAPCADVPKGGAGAATRGCDHAVPPCDDPKIYTILINGDLRDDMALDVQNMQNFLGTGRLGGLGAADVFTYRPPETGIIPNALGRIRQQFDNIAKVARPCDTIFIYASSHGSRAGGVIVERGPGEDGGAVGVAGYFYPQYLPLYDTRACHILMVFDCCFSGQIVADVQTEVTKDDSLYTGKKVVAIGAASAQQWAFGEPGGLFSSATGGYFTNALFESINEVAGQTGGSISLNNMENVFNRTYGKTVNATKDMRNAPKDYPETFGQDPQFWQRVLKPGETCGTVPTPKPSPVVGTPTPTPSPVTQPNRAPRLLRMSNVFLPDLHSNAFQVDAEDPDGDALTYTWTWQGPATACGQDQGSGSGGAKTRIYYHNGCSFAAEEGTTVTVTVRDGKGGESKHTLGLRQEGLFEIP